MQETLGSAVRLLSVLPGDLAGAIERLQADAREGQRALTALQQDLSRYRAEELAASAEQTPAGRLVLRSVEADAIGLKSLASAIISTPGFVVVLVAAARPTLVVVARSQDGSVEANQLIAALTAKFGGRGGGKPDLAQAGGLDASAEEILAAARAILLVPSG
jgi:alanyl-tRNA synthetase